MWQGKRKAVTFSFDDGTTQDVRLISILNKYGLKGTFNLNSGLLGLSGFLGTEDNRVSHNKIKKEDVKSIYNGHEVAVHTLTHPLLPNCANEEIIRQVEEDRLCLSELCGYEVVGMAYPGGGINNDRRVANVIQKHTGIQYVRTITSTYSFDKQNNLYQFNPTISFVENDLLEIVEKFLTSTDKEYQLLYIWGHAFELDFKHLLSWEAFEEVCRYLANRSNIFYGTNKEILL